MRRAAAFSTALVIFLCFSAGMHLFAEKHMEFEISDFGTWASEAKFASADGIERNMDEDSIIVMGSSEFQHGRKTAYHPESMFRNTDINTMLIGGPYYQSLSHAITLCSLEPGMEKRKVVLILSPQWFRKGGVRPEAYASRFIYTHFVRMLENESLSEQTRRYMINRTLRLLECDPQAEERVEKTVNMDELHSERMFLKLYYAFINEKNNQNMVSRAFLDSMKYRNKESDSVSVHPEDAEVKSIDFESLRERAEEDGKEHSKSNEFGIIDSYYNIRLRGRVSARKNSGAGSSYSVSEEYDDLRCFLDVCHDVGVEPLLVIIPVNGRWYDYTGFPADRRREYYDRIIEIADDYGVKTADFSDREYEEFFMEDTIHIGWKGWVDVNESIYKFAEEDEEQQ